jgi:hypothetical protein
MNLKFLKQRWQRITARIVLIFAALVLIAGFFINLYFSPILGNTVKSTVLSSSDSLYKINFTQADLHILQGKIVIFNIDLVPDTAVYNQLKKLSIAPNNLYRLHIKKLVLTHIHPFTLYFKKKLDIGEIILSAPELHITYQLNHTKDTTEKDTRTLYQRIAKTLHSVHVGRIGLNDVQFKYKDYSGNKVAISELKEMNLSATDLLIDSASMTDKSRFLYCRDVTTEINNFSGITLNGLYKYKMKLLTFSTRTSQLNVDDINLEPVSPENFFDKSRHDRFTMHIDSMQFNNFDFLTYHKYRKFSASSLILSKGSLGVFSNPRGVPKSGDRSTTFPNAGIYRLKSDLKIDTVLLNHIDIVYSELNAKSNKIGYVNFKNTSGTILNLTTNANTLKKNKYCDIALQTLFMYKSRLTVNFRFNMADSNLAYSYKGHLNPVNLQVVNPAAMPLAMVKIKSGKLKSFDFDIQADRNSSHGQVTLLYNDLKVAILKPDTVKNKLKHMTIESLYANIFIIKHDNPENPGDVPRSFYVNYKRPPESAFFKTVWKTLLIGIKSCAGFGEQKEKEIKTKMADRAVQKQERKVKKAERKLKREERKKEKELKKRLKDAEPEE